MTLTSDEDSNSKSNDVLKKDSFFNKSMADMFSFEKIKDKAFYYFQMCFELLGIYFFWIVAHYVCSHMYAHWCAPYSFIGFVLSPFFVPAPHCQAFRWFISNSSSSIVVMWTTFGTWCIKKIPL